MGPAYSSCPKLYDAAQFYSSCTDPTTVLRQTNLQGIQLSTQISEKVQLCSRIAMKEKASAKPP
jgi:hypothetical protein